MLEVVDFKPSPRMGSPIIVNGLPFMGASPGVTIWRVNNAHALHTDEGTVVWTRTHLFPMSFNNPGSTLPTVLPIRKGNKTFRRESYDKLLVLGGSMWCQLIQHWVMEGLPLLEAAMDLINSDPELVILTPSHGAEVLTRLALAHIDPKRIVSMAGSVNPNMNSVVYYANTVYLPDYSFRGCYASPPGFLAGGRVLRAIRGEAHDSKPQKAAEPNLIVFLWRHKAKGSGRSLLNGASR